MLSSNKMRLSQITLIAAIAVTLSASACDRDLFKNANQATPAMRELPAVRLNYRYEADVPAPAAANPGQAAEEKNAAVQADFDATRTQEQLDRTITSPDKKRVLAVYRNVMDQMSEVRLDMYSAEGKLLKKVTPETMAVHFPDTIVWSPDSMSVAFVAMLRATGPLPLDPNADTASPGATATNPDPEATPMPTAAPVATPASPTGILTFRTEQIYICDSEGASLKPITQNEGLIYFYYVWSPDSTMLAALAATKRDWRQLEIIADGKGEMLVPQGRLRVIEKNGRERRLDDNLTAVRPVWSPNSAKIAIAFETQVRVYDAGGTAPTQAAIPLRNQLLISSQAYDREQQRVGQAANTNSDANAAPTATPAPDQPLTTLPDEKLLVSYNPIIELEWPSDDLLYLKTAYIRRLKNEADNVTSFSRWHRLALSAQSVANK
ncbi:MAG: hypothetical protein IPJ55_02165 [Chloracidobacterium sp.]|nr:hypothetical protein [Chloracidobacterium sp.]MBK9436798.1 hypothetical protein [Chloracidobacterium sp.]MBL0241790.1 hypothetical protein [Chloracidobacterium sp.]